VAPLLVERDGGVALLRLNRPEKRNALSIELRELLMLELGALAADGEVRCAVLTGAGTAFCSGMDRNEFGGDRAHRECSTPAMRRAGACWPMSPTTRSHGRWNWLARARPSPPS
jgi:enoyl-CoA hydratase/carnithine racemase